MNKADKYQQNTSLHWAVTSGNNIAVKLLIEAGADLNAINEKVIRSPLRENCIFGISNQVMLTVSAIKASYKL